MLRTRRGIYEKTIIIRIKIFRSFDAKPRWGGKKRKRKKKRRKEEYSDTTAVAEKKEKE